MGRTKKHLVTPKKMSLIMSPEQDKILHDGAVAAGMEKDRSGWCLAHLIRAATMSIGEVNDADAPFVIEGDLAKRIRSEAERQGIAPAVVVQQWASLNGAAI